MNALRLRLIQAAGAAVVFFALVQVGRVLTGDTALNQSQTPLAFLAWPSNSSTYLTQVLPADSGPVPAETNSQESKNNPIDADGLKEKQQPPHTIQVYSQGNLVAEGSGLPATMRRTIEQGGGALMWSVRMIGVALAFLAPWIIALAAFIGIVRGIRRSWRHREH